MFGISQMCHMNNNRVYNYSFLNPWVCHLDSSWRILLAFNAALRQEHAFLMSIASFSFPHIPALGRSWWWLFLFREFHTAFLTTTPPLHTDTSFFLFFFTLKTDSNFFVSQQKQGDVTGARLADRHEGVQTKRWSKARKCWTMLTSGCTSSFSAWTNEQNMSPFFW